MKVNHNKCGKSNQQFKEAKMLKKAELVVILFLFVSMSNPFHITKTSFDVVNIKILVNAESMSKYGNNWKKFFCVTSVFILLFNCVSQSSPCIRFIFLNTY